MERWQSTHETAVACNLAESGVRPLALTDLARLGELDGGAGWLGALGAEPLGYGYTRGSPALRDAVAARHPGATRDHVVITTGTAEANVLAAWWLAAPGDEVVVQFPTYMQLPGLFRAFGMTVRPWWLHEAAGWRPDLEALERLVGPRTRAVVLCQPNNPTGAVLTDDEVAAVVAAAERVGAWILADEVYRGAELDGRPAPSAWGRSERVIVTGGLSKAFGLPGLRIGWAVAPPQVAEALCALHDYTTIGPALLSDRAATVALTPPAAPRILERTRTILRENLALLADWVAGLGGRLSWTPPRAGAIALLRYHAPIPSLELAERLRVEQDVLVVPGAHFDLEGHVRVGYGGDPAHLRQGLARLGALLEALPGSSSIASSS